jgi:uncharacterized protein (DUF1499 family)
VALVIGLWAALASGNRRLLTGVIIAAIVGGLGFLVPYSYIRSAQGLPPIHDITTDTENPPLFVAVLPLRAGARNPPEYLGEQVATRQREGYPDLKPVSLAQPPAAVHEKALAAVKSLGWELVASEPSEGRIEATETTFWYGFKDDVVIRLQPQGDGTLMDVRSKSRVGGGDVGANAARIRKFIALVSK